ncbi:SHOCT domain-containing protein [Arthrobacter sp. HY1533]|uniref:SHOCT domain-containing protein n=1 Tax=Arthrobacter sp. HY1533 TaxID=2970919 RepID=UPI0022B9D6F5|nr:SHOCT domain-containing protein [Arthrobacter sp. HY1533]
MPFIGRVGRPGLLGLAARTAVVAGTASAVGGAVTRRQNERAAASYAQDYPPAPPVQAPVQAAPAPVQAAPAAPAAPVDIVGKLTQLGELRQQGLLDAAEFERAKAQLLGG